MIDLYTMQFLLNFVLLFPQVFTYVTNVLVPEVVVSLLLEILDIILP